MESEASLLQGRSVALAGPRRTSGLHRVVIINDDSIESGGASSIALRSAQWLADFGLEVTFISGDTGARSPLANSGVDLVTIGGTHILHDRPARAATRGLYNLRARESVERWIGQNDTPGTIYHLHTWCKLLSPSIFTALKRVAERVVVMAHDFFLVCPNGGLFDYPEKATCERIPMSAECILRSCDRRNYGHKLWRVARQGILQFAVDFATSPMDVVAVYEGMIPLLARGGIPADRIAVLRNPITPWSSTRICAERNRDLFFVGRLEGDKGIDLLASAARQAKVPLRVIGVGPLQAELMERYPEFEMLGWRSREEIAELVKGARFLAMPTRTRESFGLVAVEALASGIPVIVSHTALMSAEIARRGIGLACDPNDDRALVSAIELLASDDAEVAAMSRRAYASGPSLAPDPSAWRDGLLGLYERKIAAALRGG